MMNFEDYIKIFFFEKETLALNIKIQIDYGTELSANAVGTNHFLI